jgi:hypothetical protein
MQQVYGRKERTLTRGDLAVVAGKRDIANRMTHSDNARRDAGVNCKKSAEAIVLWKHGKG